MKRTVSLIVSFMMMTAVISLPTGVFAEENTGDDNQIKSITTVQVNPLYEDTIDESEISVPEEISVPAPDPSVHQARTLMSAEYLTTEDAVVQALRDQMEARQETITLYYKKAAGMSYTEEFSSNLIYAAMAHTGVPTEGDYLKWQWEAWSGRLSWYSSGGMDYLTLTYNVKYYTTAAQEKKVDRAVDEVVDFLDLDASGKSDYVKVRAIYDYICSNVTYDNANLNDLSYKLKHTAYAAFIDDIAVCQGYALMFYRLAMEAGIDARIIAGDYNSKYTGPGIGGDDHGWNIVEINGQYYNLDATWDGDEKPFVTPYTHRFFLMSGEIEASAFDSNHIRWTEYDSAAFHNAYPMSPENFRKTSSGAATDISSWKAHLAYDRTTWDGTAKRPGVIVPGLVEGTDYKVEYRNNINVGKGIVQVKGIGDYSGSFNVTFDITAAGLPQIETVKVKLYGHDDLIAGWSSDAEADSDAKYKVEYQRYNGEWNTLTEGTSSLTQQKANLKDGVRYRFCVTPFITIDGENHYGKAKTSSYVYTLKKVSKPAAGKKSESRIKLSWTNIQGETGYQIARSAKKSKGYQTVKTVKGTEVKSAAVKTDKNKAYYYKVRAYKTVNGEKIYAPWSAPVKYTLK